IPRKNADLSVLRLVTNGVLDLCKRLKLCIIGHARNSYADLAARTIHGFHNARRSAVSGHELILPSQNLELVSVMPLFASATCAAVMTTSLSSLTWMMSPALICCAMCESTTRRVTSTRDELIKARSSVIGRNRMALVTE